jgi:hypothetical protein
MGLTPQKQAAVDSAVRKAIGPKAAVVRQIGCRYDNKKYGNYQQFLLDDGRTAFVNLDADPLTVKVSEKPNAMHFGRYKRAQERTEKLLAKKTAKEADEKPAREPKPKAAKKACTVNVVKFDKDLRTLGGTSERQGKK